jgi:hypothetical protein
MRHAKIVLCAGAACGFLTALPSMADADCFAPNKDVHIHSQIQINGANAKPGIHVRVGTEWAIVANAIGLDFDASMDAYTDANGRISGSFNYCDWLSLTQSPPLIFAFRTEFNGDARTFDKNHTSYDFGTTVNFTGTGTSPWMDPKPISKVKLRFPVRDPSLIDNFDYLLSGIAKYPGDFVFSGPFGVDHTPGPRARLGTFCQDYNGRNIPHCYGGHDAHDYMLLGGFEQMDVPNTNFVVAAADGVVDDVVDNLYDRCHFALGQSDEGGGRITCDGQHGMGPDFEPNHIYIRHDFDHPGDPAYAIKSEYLHIKKGSARVHRGQFVSCGQIIAEIGSSGISSAPHLHFAITHQDQLTDSYAGSLSRQSYWTQQDSGFRGFPATRCQDPRERYGAAGTFDAAVTSLGVQDLGIAVSPPGGPAAPAGGGLSRWYKVTVKVPVENLTGFNKDLTRVTYTLPRHAFGVASPHQSAAGDALSFYMPIAPARDPSLNEYAFDVAAEIKQTQGVASAQTVRRFVHVTLPRPALRLDVSNAKIAESAQCKTGLLYSMDVTADARGLLGATVTKWTSGTARGVLSSSPKLSVSRCAGDSPLAVSVHVTDAKGVESVSATRAYVAPAFIASLATQPYVKAGSHTLTIPAHGKVPSFSTSIYREVRIVATPHDDGGEPFPKATPKDPVSFSWADLQYRDASGAWKPIAANGSVTASYQTTHRANDTLVLTFSDVTWPTEFAGAVTVQDGWKRTATQTLRGANGALPPSHIPEWMSAVLYASGFRLHDGPGDPPLHIQRLGFGVIDPVPDQLSPIVRRMVTLGKGDTAALNVLKADVLAFHQAAGTHKATLPAFTAKPTTYQHVGMEAHDARGLGSTLPANGRSIGPAGVRR